jgi:GTP-binding protein
VQVVLDSAQHLFNQANERITTGRLNRAVRQIMDERMPSSKSGRRPKIYYATQVDVAPPTIVLVVNNPEYLDESYQRFMINRFRELLPYPEVPIKLLIRPRGAGTPAPEGDEFIDQPQRDRPPRKPSTRASATKSRAKRAARQAPPKRGRR